MQQVSATTNQHYVLADTLPAFAVRDILLVVGFAAVVGLLAQVVIPLPFTPVPITGQTFGVLLGEWPSDGGARSPAWPCMSR